MPLQRPSRQSHVHETTLRWLFNPRVPSLARQDSIFSREAAIACTMLFCLACQPGCTPRQSHSNNPAADEVPRAGASADVKRAPVVLTDFVGRTTVPVTIDGYEKAELMARVEGYVAEVLVNIGDQVHTGQVLARLDLPEMIAEHNRRLKLVEQAEANLMSEHSEVDRAEAQSAEQQALRLLRESELERARNMFQSGALKEDRLNEARYGLNAVLASVERIEADVRSAEAHVRSAEAAVEVAIAELEKSAAMMSYAEIKAPFDGVITTRMVDPGAFVRPPSSGTGALPLFNIESVERLRGVVMLPIENAARLQDGVATRLDSIRGVPDDELQQLCGLDGGPLVVSRHAGAFDRGSRMMRAEMDILNPVYSESGRRILKPGDYGKVSIELRQYSQVPSVPVSAVGTDEEGSFVFKVGDDLVCRRIPVIVLMTHQEQAALETNVQRNPDTREAVLHPGDQVVSDSLEKISDGERVP